MKCPSCGMNIRDDTLVCGYCGEKIPQKSQKQPDGPGRNRLPAGPATKASLPATDPADEGGEEEEGGLSPYLQAGEQVLIGSLNVSVKKFFFHAYLTDRRIFLIDTQEKKLKVTAKDVPRNTLAGSIIEYSENSDPVLVLSIRSPDDDIKTMKIVFVQNGMDRSSEIDEWIALLHKEDEPLPKKSLPVPEEPAVEPLLSEPEPALTAPRQKAAVKSQELKPARKPGKDLEKQPPVKRLVSFSTPAATEPETAPVPAAAPPRRTQVRQVVESPRKTPVVMDEEPGIRQPAASRETAPAVKKPEVQTAMKVAMKSALKPLSQPAVRPPRRDIPDHIVRRPVVEPEPAEEPAEQPIRRPRISDRAREPVYPEYQEPAAPVHEEPAEVPQFCHNCGKKLPIEANFCPGCGTRLGQNRTLPNTRTTPPAREKRPVPADTVPAERRQAVPILRPEDPDDEDYEDEKPQPTKPPVKKAPKGSEMTILHKFLRR